MTDLELLRAMLTRAGVAFHHQPERDYERPPQAVTLLVIRETHTTAVNLGYHNFESVFYFDAAGALVAVGAWE